MWGHIHLLSCEKATVITDFNDNNEPISILWEHGSIRMSVKEALEILSGLERAIHAVAAKEGAVNGQ